MSRGLYSLLGTLLATLMASTALAAEGAPDRPNFLFIAVDDLRPEMAGSGTGQAITPNIDSLAAEGLSFTRHYVQTPTCGASRFALLTGQIPVNKRHVNNHAVRTEIGDAKNHDYITFPRYLRENGYRTVALGKISHYPGGIVAPNTGPNPNPRPELPGAWDVSRSPSAQWGTEQNAFFGYADGSSRNSLEGNVPPFEAADVDDEGYPDGQIAEMAIEQIEQLSRQDKPFLLAVGFYKPHLPFNAPQKYWSLYQRDDIALSPNPYIPEAVTETNTLHGMGEINRYKLGKEKPELGKNVSDDYARELRHGYFAATSYVDAQIGRVLEALKANGQAENTVVILWGDHGWHLGDQTIWGKHTLYERSLRSPLIIKVPAQKPGTGPVPAIVETVDIYPTITDLAGLPRPVKLSGENLLKSDQGSGVARSFWRESVSLRNERFRIIVHGERYPEDVELYDHTTDPNETRNVAGLFADEAKALFEEARALELKQGDEPEANFVAGELIRFTGKDGSPNGAWCWFQDERAIIDASHPDEPVLMFTSISASKEVEAEKGDLDFHWYGLDSGIGGVLEFHDRFGQDDHNVAALFQLHDGRALAVYSRHNDDKNTYYRYSAPHQPDSWNDAHVYEGAAKSTYNNLLTAGADLKLLDFSRLQGWNPNFLTWNDQAETWQYGGRLLSSEGRPYLKYANTADGTKIHVVSTDQHPRDFDNSIYHGVTDGKVLFNSTGEVLDRDLSDQDAVEPSELTVVFAGDPDNVAWMADVEMDRNDQPVIAFSVQKDGRDKPKGSGGLDHRYHLARHDPGGWQQWEIAYAGERLYPGEDDYTGLVAIDPEDVNYLVISTNADPVSGAPLISNADGQHHYELFAGTIEETGVPVAWQPLTRNSTVDNIRPIMPAWDSDRRVILWMRGSYSKYKDFNTQIVGIIQPR